MLTYHFCSFRVPQEHQRLWAVLSWGNQLARMRHAERCHVVGVALLRLVFLLWWSEVSLAATEKLLRHVLVVKDDSERGCWVHCMALGIEAAVLACFFWSVTPHPVDFVVLYRCFLVWLRMSLWLLDCAQPWLDCSKLISFSRFNSVEQSG